MVDTILLLGGTGLLGTELRLALSSEHMNVIAPPRSGADMTDYASLDRIITQDPPDLIINAAALIDVNALEQDPLPGWQVNALGAGAIARILQQRSLEIPYLLVSTNYVFGNSYPFYTEHDVPAPINVYGATKAQGEALQRRYCADLAVPYYTVRTGWIYSPARPTFVDLVATTLLDGQVFEAAIDQRGNVTSASELAKSVVREFVRGSPESGVYHLVADSDGECGVSRYDIACAIASILGVASSFVVPTSSDGVFAARRPSAVLHNTKLPALRGWREVLTEFIEAHYGRHAHAWHHSNT